MTTNAENQTAPPEAPAAPVEAPVEQQGGLLDITTDDQLEIESPEPVVEDSPTEEPVVGESPDATTTTQAAPADPPEIPEQTTAPGPQQQQVSQAEVEELQRRRQEETQRAFRDDLGRKARTYEQQLTDAGYLPEQARAQAKQYMQNEMRSQQQEQKALDLVGFVEGRQMAALHFMEKNGLADKQFVSDYQALLSSADPQQMEREAQRMKKERDTDQELARLRQGQVPPQTFDNSQGAAEASTSDDRLLTAYLNGDRSQAATEAARRMTFGS